MSTVKALIDYCNIDCPVGALLLTGEWGCGKTYLVENNLKESLKETHVIIRISLFGISSIEELHMTIKSKWISVKGGLIGRAIDASKFGNKLKGITDLIPNNVIKEAAGTLLSINPMDYINVENSIDKKRVVLVFDDLERNELSISEKLGVINEYCENKHFNVIIIADEEKLKDGSYKDIKEKVVQRTIHHTPDYKSVVNSIIETEKDTDYRSFLKENEHGIAALFAGTDLDGNSLDQESERQIYSNTMPFDKNREINRQKKLELLRKRPHNIRSLKSAVQDFKQVYIILKDNDVDDTYKWLYAFVSFSMASKANLVQKSKRVGTIFGYQDVAVLYPGFFDSRYMPLSIVNWVNNGVLDKEELVECLKEIYKITEHSSPLEKVKNNRIDYYEEDVAIKGMNDIIKEAYDGTLTLNEYVYFIINVKLTRQYDLVKLDIDWNKVREGIEKRINNNIKNGIPRERHTHSIGDLTDYLDDEKSAYSLIESARKLSLVLFEQNRNEYIRLMNDNPYEAFILLSDKRFNCFDNEMAEATSNAFKIVDNYTKTQFIRFFEGMWINYRHSFDIGKDGVSKTEQGFETLKHDLIELSREYSEQPFKKKFTEEFISVVDGLLAEDE